jgi:preprotein translocase subunit SecE
VADRNRGRSVGDDDGDDRPDDVDDEFEVLDDDVSDADADADDVGDLADEDDVDDDTDDTSDEPVRSRKRKVSAGASGGGVAVARAKSKEATGRKGGGGIPGFGRLARFVREIVAELQKVIWPTRKELLTYTTVVVVFVAIMMTFVSLLDLGFVRVMFLVFGRGTSGSATTTP